MEFTLGNKIFERGCVTVDGRMDEPVWQEAQAFTNFKALEANGGHIVEQQTCFKILPCADRLYIGVRCEEPDMEWILETTSSRSPLGVDSVEVFLSPSCSPFCFYQFFVNIKNVVYPFYYEESGFTQPDPYAPSIKTAVYTGDDFWSVEMEIPFTALYMTPNNIWQETWSMNVARTRNKNLPANVMIRQELSTWSPMNMGFFDSDRFTKMSGFPMRAIEDDVYISHAAAEMTEKTENGYTGLMKVVVNNAVGGEFTFTSEHSDPITVTLPDGGCEFAVPSHFTNINRQKISMSLTRNADGATFARVYPVMVTYEPVKVRFTLPEYRDNFYPGQDCSKIVGTALSEKPVTLKLVGPGIPEQVITPNADGSFCFETPGFEEGDAYLTASIDGFEITKKISRLAPTGRMMSWISGGNLIVNGEPVLRRNVYADGWRGGQILKKRYATEPQYQTPHVRKQPIGYIEACALIKGIDSAGGESHNDAMPSDALFRKMDETIEANKDLDFSHYYISDEPECRQVSPIWLRHVYEYMMEKDPYHVCLLASRAADMYVDCADWFETHAYLGVSTKADGTRTYQRPINTIGRFVDDIAKFNRPDKCIGFLPTAFAYKYLSRAMDYPTFDEMICHVWAAMIRGGKSLWPFAYMDFLDRAAMYEGNRYVFSTFEALEEFILHAKRTTILNTTEVEAATFDLPDKKMFVLMNKVAEPQTVTLDAISGTWCEFRHARDITTNTFELKPFEVIVGTTEDMSGDLPTYQEIKAICDNHDYKRTHSKNLLYERYDDMVVTTSASDRGNYKMFDGVFDNLAWECEITPGTRERFIHLDMSNIKPTFSKVVLAGWHMDGTLITAGTEGDMKTLEFADVKSEEYRVTYTLKAPVTADAIHFSFENQEKYLEVYEIELLA